LKKINTFPTPMPDSSEGEQAVAGSGEQERSLADTTNGGRPRPLLRSLEYPCTARLRLRRLLAYQRRYSHWEIYDAYALLIFLDSIVLPSIAVRVILFSLFLELALVCSIAFSFPFFFIKKTSQGER